jgi:hypothetical protein
VSEPKRLHGQADRSWAGRIVANRWPAGHVVVPSWQNGANALIVFSPMRKSEDCSYVTILLARIGDLSSLPEICKKLRRDLRNVRDGMARKSASWNSLSFLGHIELDALEETDVPLLGSSRRAVVRSFPQSVDGVIPCSGCHTHTCPSTTPKYAESI